MDFGASQEVVLVADTHCQADTHSVEATQAVAVEGEGEGEVEGEGDLRLRAGDSTGHAE